MFRVTLLLLVLTSTAQAESFDGSARFGSSGSRNFIAPDIPGNFQSLGIPEIPSDIGNWNTGTADIADLQNVQPELAQLGLKEEPALAEFNYYGTDAQRQLVMSSLQQDLLVWNFHRDSSVSIEMTAACRKCMIAGNWECVAMVCRQQIDFRPHRHFRKKDGKIDTQAFVTGTSLYGDILCSLCKRSHDVTCTMRHCVDPERDQNAINSGVECNGDFCRWQKEAVLNTGFNNNYHAWWQPQNLYFFFDHVTKEITSAYNEFLSSTSKAINGLGKK